MNAKHLLLLAMLSVQSLAYAQGSNYYYADDRQNLHAGRQESVHDSISAWCDDRLEILFRAKTYASQAVFRGDYKASIDILIKGLADAGQGGYTFNPPLTQKMMERGVKLGQTLKTRGSIQLNGYKAVSHFLESYYGFVEGVANTIDIHSYEPGRCGYCHVTTAEMEERLIDLTKRQLTLVNDTLVAPGTVIPLGPSDLYLKAQEMVTYYASYDLRSLMASNVFSCQIRELLSIHENLKRFNNGPRSESQKRLMIFNSFHEVESVNERILTYRQCH